MIVILLFILGSAWGSFLNVVICRVQQKKQFTSGRSMCPNCRSVIGWSDLIPLLSWVLLHGKCRNCKNPISIQYPLLELTTGLLFVLGSFVVASQIIALLYLAVISFFVILFVYDLKTYIIPDNIVIPGVITIFVLNVLAGQPIVGLLVGGLFGGLWFLLQFVVSKGRWVGGGDIRLGIMMGVLLGQQLIWLSLGLAYIGGSIIALFLLATKLTTLKSRLPFATMLLPSAFIVWIWGDTIWQWYSNVVGL